ncbi:MAG: hypothetical protein A3F42_01310 [Gammaproteobacteria bacterium RIFCSPHIGHO2_12_FULL_37_34]|nr:MAG: hypothetical protein A3F42_01310 [Gammaproteobacteria bacterium RIFCSPHIGHO2_12_FULL_37_34]
MMKHYFYSLSLVANYLEMHDRLSLRCVNRAVRTCVQTNQKGPYSTKATFTLATSGFFNTKENLDSAWVAYYITIQSSYYGPAILYKLNDLFKLSWGGILTKFGGLSHLDKTGQRYSPDKHLWHANLCWVLAQIHANRPFVILSNISLDNIHRQDSSSKFSAFAKEIAAAYKAGYRVSLIEKMITKEGNEYFEMTLQPPLNDLKKLTITDISPTDCEISSAINEIGDNQCKWEHTHRTSLRF